MKIRLAKKIMSRRTTDIPLYRVHDIWILKWILSECKVLGISSLFGTTFFGNKYPNKIDNHILKAKKLTSKRFKCFKGLDCKNSYGGVCIRTTTKCHRRYSKRYIKHLKGEKHLPIKKIRL